MSTIPELPSLSLSYSAIRMLSECERKWWLTHIGAWRGWERDNPALSPEARLAYEGKNLRTLPQALGIAVHRVAERAAVSWASGGRGLPEAAIVAELRGELNALYQRTRATFLARPKLGMLAERYFGRTIAPAVLDETRDQLRAAAQRLAGADVHRDLADCARGDVLVIEGLESVALPLTAGDAGEHGRERDLPSIPLYGRPDLLYVSRRSLVIDGVRIPPGDTGLVVVADIKTGRAATDRPQIARQLAAMALFASLRGLPAHPVVPFIGRVVDVTPTAPIDDLLLPIGPDDLAQARAAFTSAAARLQAMPRDGRGVIRRDATELAPQRSRACPTCNLRAACELTAAPYTRPGHAPAAAPSDGSSDRLSDRADA